MVRADRSAELFRFQQRTHLWSRESRLDGTASILYGDWVPAKQRPGRAQEVIRDRVPEQIYRGNPATGDPHHFAQCYTQRAFVQVVQEKRGYHQIKTPRLKRKAQGVGRHAMSISHSEQIVTQIRAGDACAGNRALQPRGGLCGTGSDI